MRTAIWDYFLGLVCLPSSGPLLPRSHPELSCQVQIFTLLSLNPRMLIHLKFYPLSGLLHHTCPGPRGIIHYKRQSVHQFFLHKEFLFGLVRTTVLTRVCGPDPAVMGHRPNQEGIPGHRGSLLCLCWGSSSSRGSGELGSFSGKRSGKVKVCPWAWRKKQGLN